MKASKKFFYENKKCKSPIVAEILSGTIFIVPVSFNYSLLL